MKRIVVTGANKGIGLAIVKRLLKEHPDVFVYLGSRDLGRGMAAMQEIGSEMGEQVKKHVKLLQLDVTSDASVQRSVAIVKEDLANNSSDTLYGVVNNAGGGISGASASQVIDLNMYGVLRVTEAFLPLLQNEGRIVQLSSGAGPGFVKSCSDEKKFLMANKSDVTWEDIQNEVIQPILKIVEDPALSREEKGEAMMKKGLGGYADWLIYGMTKACVSTYTFALSNKYPHLKMNSCSPGYIETDLTTPLTSPGNKKPAGMLPVEKGTISPLHLLMSNNLEGNGRFYGSDAKRSPMHKPRNPGEPEYDGSYP